ncbi:MAG: hypothetical protein ACRDIY_00315 [Chloroflexota bacterium]
MVRQPRRSNPDATGDILLLLAVVAVAAVGYEVVKSDLAGTLGQPGSPNPASSAGNALGTAAGSFATGAVTGAANSILLQGQDICSLIQGWRALGSPTFSLLYGFPLLPNIHFGGGDPNSWANFRQYLSSSGFVDPGPYPPAGCW